MYWQEGKARHAITPRFDRERSDPDLFPAVAGGLEEPGLAFYRPVQNEWFEYDLDARCWFTHPSHQNIQYTPLYGRSAQFMHTTTPTTMVNSSPQTPRGVPAASTPVNLACAPMTPPAWFGHGAPGTPTGSLGPAPSTPTGWGADGWCECPGTPTDQHISWSYQATHLGAEHTPVDHMPMDSAPIEHAAAEENMPEKRARLEREKKRAIEAEDFDLAKVLKQELDQLTALEMQQDREVGECCICLEDTETFYVCLPCGHTCACDKCAPQLTGKPCPMCRALVQRVNVTHFAFRRQAKYRRV